MSYRYMRLMLFFDLPVEKAKQKREYRTFVKKIKSFGFYMMQKSVYIKMGIDNQVIESTLNKIKAYLPSEGNVFVLSITEKQFASIEFLLGENSTDVINSDDRIIKL